MLIFPANVSLGMLINVMLIKKRAYDIVKLINELLFSTFSYILTSKNVNYRNTQINAKDVQNIMQMKEISIRAAIPEGLKIRQGGGIC